MSAGAYKSGNWEGNFKFSPGTFEEKKDPDDNLRYMYRQIPSNFTGEKIIYNVNGNRVKVSVENGRVYNWSWG